MLRPDPIKLPFRYKSTVKSPLSGLPENVKKYIPGSGAVKIPDPAFIAPPTFSLSNSNGIATFFVPKLVFLWT